ncbi:MAG: M50 family metallopeptidase [Candidatus Micrarchaeota archaeon]|nr:M50 family metallopeptidase [Candidatus Micrarchaeota archaeon]
MRLTDLCGMESCKLAATVIVSFLLFILILTSDASGFLKGIISIALLLVTGLIIRSITKADGWSGFLMLKIKEGLDFINWANRVFGKWMDQVSDFGLVFGFGVSSLRLFPHIEKKTVIISLAILLLFSLFVSPFITVIALSAIELPQTDVPQSSSNEIAIASLLVLILIGFAGFVALGLLSKAVSVLYSVFLFAFGVAQKIDSTPGVSFIIPGITIPLLEGAIALVLLLVIHEGAHGIEAIRSRVKIKSSGLLLFGFIPVGAFVDINENDLLKRQAKHKLRVAAAGAASNIVATIIFFIPTLILLFALPGFYSDKVAIIGFSKNIAELNVTPGTQLYSINGVEINSLTDFNMAKKTLKPNSSAVLETSKGTFDVKTGEDGTLGIIVSPEIKEEFWWIRSLYLVFALLTVLNFFVGVINLLPVQAFDGHRILQDSMKNKRIVDIISYTVLFALILNLVPWVWS